MAYTRLDEAERQARRLMGTPAYTQSHHPDHKRVHDVVSRIYKTAYPGATPPASGVPVATGPASTIPLARYLPAS
jgi:LmbE family N-acetylglucosaminyl deacetylase